MKYFLLFSMLSIFSCKQNKNEGWLPDSKFYVIYELQLEKGDAAAFGAQLKTHISTKLNLDPQKPRVSSTAFYLAKGNTLNRFRQRMIILTNFVNERSRKREFDNLELHEFISKTRPVLKCDFGGNEQDFQNDDYELLFKDFYVQPPVDSSWLIEDPAKISLFHNDYEVLQKIAIKGFDEKGEPEIRVMDDGSIFLVFNFMPPTKNVDDNLGEFEGFDKYLEKELNVKVQWTDREVFYIERPNSDTVEKLKYILENYWKAK